MSERRPADPLAERCSELVHDHLRQAEQDIIGEMMRAMDAGPLDPQLAMQKWAEIKALREVPKRLKLEAKRAAQKNY